MPKQWQVWESRAHNDGEQNPEMRSARMHWSAQKEPTAQSPGHPQELPAPSTARQSSAAACALTHCHLGPDMEGTRKHLCRCVSSLWWEHLHQHLGASQCPSTAAPGPGELLALPCQRQEQQCQTPTRTSAQTPSNGKVSLGIGTLSQWELQQVQICTKKLLC